MDMAAAIKEIRARIPQTGCFTLGIDGLGGAGKSTLSQALVEAFGQERQVILLHLDDFIHPRSIRYNDSVPEWRCYYEVQWRYDYFLSLLQRLKREASGVVEVELYNKEQDSYDVQEFTLQPDLLIVVEGVFLQREALTGAFDCVLYLDVPEEERLRRVLERDGYIGSREEIADKYARRYFPAEREYLRRCSPRERADLVVEAL